jgi:hypothetical protein
MRNTRSPKLLLAAAGIVILATGPASWAQMGPPPGTCEITSGEKSVRIPFKLIGTYAVLPAELGGRTIGLVLDTGMPAHGVLLHAGSEADTYGLAFVGKAPVRGAGGGTVVSDLAVGVQINLPGVVLKDQMAIVMPYAIDRHGAFSREGLHGVIGLSLFDRFVVHIDYDERVIVLQEPDSYTPPAEAEILPFTFRRNIPLLTCSARMPGGSTATINLVVDSGNSQALVLNVGSQESIAIPSAAVETRIGTGATGDIVGHAGRIPWLKIGSHRFENVIASFKSKPETGAAAEEAEGILGAEILRRFKVTFDYGRKRLILRPGSSLSKPFECDMSGLDVSRREDGRLAINRVVRASAAEEAGLGPQDIIEEVMGRPAGDVGLIEFREMMKTEGNKVTLGVDRLGKKRTVTLTLRRQI